MFIANNSDHYLIQFTAFPFRLIQMPNYLNQFTTLKNLIVILLTVNLQYLTCYEIILLIYAWIYAQNKIFIVIIFRNLKYSDTKAFIMFWGNLVGVTLLAAGSGFSHS